MPGAARGDSLGPLARAVLAEESRSCETLDRMELDRMELAAESASTATHPPLSCDDSSKTSVTTTAAKTEEQEDKQQCR